MLLGDLIIWYYEDLAGIKCAPGSVAYKKLWMEPKFPEGLSHVKASYNSVYGEIKSEWTKDNNSFTWDIVIPANTFATVKLPKQLNIASPSGKGIHKVTETDDAIEIELGSGRYQLKSK
jgi:alpha-L-rhamnosidase